MVVVTTRKVLCGEHELFPLPFLPSEPAASNSLCRATRKRVCCRRRINANCNSVIHSLNTMFGVKSDASRVPSSAQASVVERVRASVSASPPACNGEDAEEALRSLLGAKSSAYCSAGPVGVADYHFDLLSLPATGGGCDLLSSLDGQDREDLGSFSERLLLTEGDVSRRQAMEGKARAYWSPELSGNYDNYVQLVRELHSRSMVTFDFSADCFVGIFVVKKKNGKLRLIIDCRRLNQLLKKPPRTRLASSAVFGDVDLGDFAGDVTYASHDVVDCFYQFRIPG